MKYRMSWVFHESFSIKVSGKKRKYIVSKKIKQRNSASCFFFFFPLTSRFIIVYPRQPDIQFFITKPETFYYFYTSVE